MACDSNPERTQTADFELRYKFRTGPEGSGEVVETEVEMFTISKHRTRGNQPIQRCQDLQLVRESGRRHR